MRLKCYEHIANVSTLACTEERIRMRRPHTPTACTTICSHFGQGLTPPRRRRSYSHLLPGLLLGLHLWWATQERRIVTKVRKSRVAHREDTRVCFEDGDTLSLSLSLLVCVYVHVCVCMCVRTAAEVSIHAGPPCAALGAPIMYSSMMTREPRDTGILFTTVVLY